MISMLGDVKDELSQREDQRKVSDRFVSAQGKAGKVEMIMLMMMLKG